MAKTLKEFIKDSAKIGHYTESTGGGTPLPKGEKLKDHPEAKRVKQPRDEDGRFAHNSVNLKPLKYKSRGKTVPAFLRDTEVVFAKKTGKFSLVDEAGKKYRMPHGIETAKDLIIAMTYARENGTFSGISLNEVIKGKGGKTAGAKETYDIVKKIMLKNKEDKKYYDVEFCKPVDSPKKKVESVKTENFFKKAEKKEEPKKDTDTVDIEKIKSDKEYFYKNHEGEINSFMEKFKERVGEETTKEDIYDIFIENGIGSFTELNEYFDMATK